MDQRGGKPANVLTVMFCGMYKPNIGRQLGPAPRIFRAPSLPARVSTDMGHAAALPPGPGLLTHPPDSPYASTTVRHAIMNTPKSSYGISAPFLTTIRQPSPALPSTGLQNQG